jgi:hypothetical protein
MNSINSVARPALGVGRSFSTIAASFTGVTNPTSIRGPLANGGATIFGVVARFPSGNSLISSTDLSAWSGAVDAVLTSYITAAGIVTSSVFRAFYINGLLFVLTNQLSGGSSVQLLCSADNGVTWTGSNQFGALGSQSGRFFSEAVPEEYAAQFKNRLVFFNFKRITPDANYITKLCSTSSASSAMTMLDHSAAFDTYATSLGFQNTNNSKPASIALGVGSSNSAFFVVTGYDTAGTTILSKGITVTDLTTASPTFALSNWSTVFTTVPTTISISSFGTFMLAIVRYGGLYGTTYSSDGGNTWSTFDSSLNALVTGVHGVVWAGDAFLVYANPNLILRTTNGTYWSSVTAPANNVASGSLGWLSVLGNRVFQAALLTGSAPNTPNAISNP